MYSMPNFEADGLQQLKANPCRLRAGTIDYFSYRPTKIVQGQIRKTVSGLMCIDFSCNIHIEYHVTKFK